jgi:hypothetical protein
MPTQSISDQPMSFLEFPCSPQSVGQWNETPPVRICFRPEKLLQFSDVDFKGLFHRSILGEAGERAEEKGG